MKATLLSAIILALTIHCLPAQTPPAQVRLSVKVADPQGKILSDLSIAAKDNSKSTISITRDKETSKENPLPVGTTLTFSPKIDGKTITYTGQITTREAGPSTKSGGSTLLAFKTTEFLFSGAATSGKPVRFTLPDKSVVTLEFSLQGPDGELLSKR
jgi:hypothetical protein